MDRVKKLKAEKSRFNPDDHEIRPHMLIQVKQKKEITISFDMARIEIPEDVPPSQDGNSHQMDPVVVGDDNHSPTIFAPYSHQKGGQTPVIKTKQKSCCAIM